jgi:cytochrome c
MRRVSKLGLALLAALAASPAGAQALNGEALYKEKTCIACHGADAKTPILPNYPKLAGQNAAYLLQQAMDIKSGARNNANTAAMKGVMHLVSDDELKAIADWLATLKP